VWSHEQHKRNIDFGLAVRDVFVGDFLGCRDDDRGWAFDSDDGGQWHGVHGLGAHSR
jgi:hypothetical protein